MAARHERHAESMVTQVSETVDAMLDADKPKLRGWLHLGMAPLAGVLGLILVVMTPTRGARAAAAVFTLTAALLFATSATFHIGKWSARQGAVLRRLDHSNIFLIIAGSYTPFTVLLDPDARRTMLLIVWGGAIIGVAFRIFWLNAPRWIYVPAYVALGWVAIFYFSDLLAAAGWLIVSLIAIGGLFYTLGAMVYGFKRPDPSPQWFGYHEIFHALTIAAFLSHYVAASLALYGSGAPS